MSQDLEHYIKQKIKWKKTGSFEYPYKVDFDEKSLVVKLNDFPVESMYTLIVNNVESGDFDDWPALWVRPENN